MESKNSMEQTIQTLKGDNEELMKENASLKKQISGFKTSNANYKKQIAHLKQLDKEGDELNEKRIAEMDLTEKKSHFRRMMTVSAIGFVALLVLVFFIWRILQHTRKGNADIASHNEEIKTQNEESNGKTAQRFRDCGTYSGLQ